MEAGKVVQIESSYTYIYLLRLMLLPQICSTGAVRRIRYSWLDMKHTTELKVKFFVPSKDWPTMLIEETAQ